MRILYLDIFAGISGDMTVGALLDAGVSLIDLKSELDKVPLPNFSIAAKKVTKGELSGTRFLVEAGTDHPHRHLTDIFRIIDQSGLKPVIKEKARNMFYKLAQAEGKIHNTNPQKIHFHEVGAVDSIVDILATLICMDLLRIEKVVSSPIPLARGWINCHHGLIPAPAPAALELLTGVPTVESKLEGETVTPTGALLTVCLADNFGPPPAFTLDTIGYGAGAKDLPVPNLLRVMVGTKKQDLRQETIWIIETNLDDFNPEFYPHLMGLLLKKGALDAFITPVIMKKGRPGVLLTVLSHYERLSILEETIFSETSTLGVRVRQESRAVLPREFITVNTAHGPLKVKYSKDPANGQILNIAPEYEDCRVLAEGKGVPIKAIYLEGLALAQALLGSK